jgi:hypothetical protein
MFASGRHEHVGILSRRHAFGRCDAVGQKKALGSRRHGWGILELSAPRRRPHSPRAPVLFLLDSPHHVEGVQTYPGTLRGGVLGAQAADHEGVYTVGKGP